MDGCQQIMEESTRHTHMGYHSEGGTRHLYLLSICPTNHFTNTCHLYLPSIRPTNHFTIIRHLYLLSIYPTNRPPSLSTFYISYQSSAIFICFLYVLPIIRHLYLLSIYPTNHFTNIRHLYLHSIRPTNHFTIIRHLYLLSIYATNRPPSLSAFYTSYHSFAILIMPCHVTGRHLGFHPSLGLVFILFPLTL
jgi:hypothetical protein